MKEQFGRNKQITLCTLLASNACVYTDSNGASNASVPTNTKNHQFPFGEIDGFLLVGKNPKPT